MMSKQDAFFLIAAGISAERRWHMADLYSIVSCLDTGALLVPIGHGHGTENIFIEVFRGRDGREIAMGYGPVTGTLAIRLKGERERPIMPKDPPHIYPDDKPKENGRYLVWRQQVFNQRQEWTVEEYICGGYGFPFDFTVTHWLPMPPAINLKEEER
jgi:hypothetical protein